MKKNFYLSKFFFFQQSYTNHVVFKLNQPTLNVLILTVKLRKLVENKKLRVTWLRKGWFIFTLVFQLCSVTVGIQYPWNHRICVVNGYTYNLPVHSNTVWKTENKMASTTITGSTKSSLEIDRWCWWQTYIKIQRSWRKIFMKEWKKSSTNKYMYNMYRLSKPLGFNRSLQLNCFMHLGCGDKFTQHF